MILGIFYCTVYILKFCLLIITVLVNQSTKLCAWIGEVANRALWRALLELQVVMGTSLANANLFRVKA